MKKIFLVLMCFCMATSIALAQTTDMSAPINPDPHVKIGKLSNGMTYYIRHNEYPKNHVELRLAVNAGSNQENENQRGLAHFTEHMAFNGIEGFPGNTMVEQLQKMGVVFGADLNAYTSFDETVFMIPMQLTDTNYLNVGLKILRGWAHGLLYDSKEIDAERGVITEEYRMGLGASDRMQKKYWPVLMSGSRYADRVPIGLLDVIQHFQYQTIKDFYHDWYRPDLQAIIVVGDIDVNVVEAKIKAMFGNIPAVQNPRVKEDYPIASNKEPLISICTDKEAMGSQVMIIRKFPHFAMKTVGDFRKHLIIDLYNTMYDSRLSDMQQDPKCPFLGASSGYGQLIGSTDMYGAQASVKENQIIPTMQLLIKEDNRVLKYGFVQTELDRAKAQLMENYERASNEVDKTESASFASQYIDNFLHHDPIPGAKREYNYAKKFLEDITLNEVNALAKDWITPDNIVAIVMAPDKPGVKVPTEQDVLNVLKDKSLEDVTPYVDTYKEKELVNKDELVPGTIVKSVDIPEINAKHITLSNGINVILKHTDFKNDEILFEAISKGGKSLYGVKDLASLDFAPNLVDRAGIADLDFSTLSKKMKGKQVGLMPGIDALSESFTGSSTPKDLEFFFQYLHAYFTNPRTDTSAYSLVMNEAQEQMKMLNANPMYKFFGAFLDAATNHDPYKINQLSYTQEYLNQVNYDRAVKLFKERFANPADFIYTFVGNFDEKTMENYLNLYLGSLKTTPNKSENFNASAFKPNTTGIQKEKVLAGTEAQSWMGLYFKQPYEYNAKNNMIVRELGDALEIYLIKIVREKMGDVYSPMMQMDYDKYPSPEFQMLIMLSCAPENTDKLADACLKILKDFAAKGPDKETLQKVQTQLISTREKDVQTNKFWLGYINGKNFTGDDMNAVNQYNDLVNSITKKDIINFMKTYFKMDQYTRVDLYPENSGK